jgi:hypothetical protein
MKPLYIYASRLRAFWVLVPMSIVLTLALRFNPHVDGLVKLYPLIIFCIGAIIFTFIYYFRLIAISYSEIKYIGKFTSRDSATVNEGKTLVIELLEKRRVSIRLYGNEGYNPDIKWLNDDGGTDRDICLFRGRAYGNEQIAVKILLHFGVDAKDIDSILIEEGYEQTYENVTVTTALENGHKQFKIRFDKTV